MKALEENEIDIEDVFKNITTDIRSHENGKVISLMVLILKYYTENSIAYLLIAICDEENDFEGSVDVIQKLITLE